jgi:hypothetical protein
MSIVVKTLACGSLSNGQSSNGDNTKSVRVRHSTGGIMSSKKVKVSFDTILMIELPYVMCV